MATRGNNAKEELTIQLGQITKKEGTGESAMYVLKRDII
jgi:hypothetical protein